LFVHFSGPVVSALTNKYGCRAVSIAGSILSAFGFAISVFAPNLYYLYFTFGIVSGEFISDSYIRPYMVSGEDLSWNWDEGGFLISLELAMFL